MRDTIIYSSLRAFFVTVATMLGLAIGILCLIVFFAVFDGSSINEPKRVFKKEILANAEGVRTVQPDTAPVILQLNIDGVIGLESLNSETVRQQLVESREGDFKNDRVKGILLHINTPGGTVVDSDNIYRAVKDYKAKYRVPVIAYVDGLCASGGMYVASAADEIFASDVSMIGSVGVLSPSFLNFSKTIETLGIEALTLTAGKNKDIMNPLRQWKPDEQKPIQNIINAYYDQFVNLVAENRPKLNKQKLIEVYGANIFIADEAYEIGMIDAANTSRSDALKELLKRADIPDDNYQVVQLEKESWLKELISGESVLFTGKVKHEFNLPKMYDSRLLNQYLYLYIPGC